MKLFLSEKGQGIRQRESPRGDGDRGWRGTPCEAGREEGGGKEDQRDSVRPTAISWAERGYIHLQYGVEGTESDGNRTNLRLVGSL